MEKIQSTQKFQLKQASSKMAWWIPLWKGLVFDSKGKHRKKMGSSLWLYLYLLFSVNRKTGIVTRKQKVMAEDTGLTIRTIQNHLLRLKLNNYITVEKQSRPLNIHITKYKLFNHKQFDAQ